MCVFILLLVLIISFPFVMINLTEKIRIIIDNWYCNLEYGIQKLINKIVLIIFVGGIMVYMLLKTPQVVKTKNKKFDKVRIVIELLVFEAMFGFVFYNII